MECTNLQIEQMQKNVHLLKDRPLDQNLVDELLMRSQTYYQPNEEVEYKETAFEKAATSDLEVMEPEYDGYVWEYKLRTVPKEIIEMEEKERQWRMSHGVNPMMFTRLFRVQTELMHKHIPTTYWNDAKASLSSTIFTAKEATRERASSFSERFNNFAERAHDVAVNLTHTAGEMIHQLDVKSQEFAVNTNHKVDEMTASLSRSIQNIDERQEEFSVATNEKAAEMKEDIKESAQEIREESSELYSETKGKMGEIRTTVAEERERARRMNSKQDANLIEKRHTITEELLNNIKTVN